MAAAFALVGPAAIAGQAPHVEYHLATRTGVECHTGPSDDLPAAARYYVGDLIGATKSAPGPRHATWYFDSWRASGSAPSCWIDARFTVPYDRKNREAAYLGIADSLLARKDSVTFEEYVDVLNLFESSGPEQPAFGPGVLGRKDTSLFERYPRLRYERLLIIERAIHGLRRSVVLDQPLTRAWIAAHSDVLEYFEPGAIWEIPATAYWSIYDAHRAEAWAEPVAWTAAQDRGDADEPDAEYFLLILARGPEGYWDRLPQGAHVADAVTLASQLAADALTQVDEGPPKRSTIDSVRASLRQVSAPNKGKLLELLQRLELKAK